MRKNKGINTLQIGLIICALLIIGGCADHTEKKKKSEAVKTNVTNSETKEGKPTIPEDKKKLPSQGQRVKIDLELYIQENNYFCGPAVIRTILHHFNIDKSQNELAKEMHTSSVTGTEYIEMAQVLNREIFHNTNPSYGEAGYHIQTLPLRDYQKDVKIIWQPRMRKNIDDGYPSILAVNMHTLYPHMKQVNHFVICMGYLLDQDNQVEYYYLLDPFYGVQDEVYRGLKYYTPDELWSAIVENEEPAYIY